MSGNDAYRQSTNHPAIYPPPLPPRNEQTIPSPPMEAPPPYSETVEPSQHPLLSLTSHDPRSSSTQSLVPEERTRHDPRRKLLLVYVHGFMGAESSFRSFPAHVHNLLAITLAESHVVHTKIYPRYQSRRHIQFATEDFSKWLAPHESPTTDVVLLGHSMGGLLIAEVVLLRPYRPEAGRALRHRILGTVNFDVPFLGMHPGVIKSGLGSIFNPAPPPTDQPSSSSSPGLSPQQSDLSSYSSTISLDASGPMVFDPLGSPQPTDPNFNPGFENDIHRPIRTGWNSMFHFAMKHKDNLLKATKQLVASHLEFGGAMADFSGLKSRYARLRALEEEDEARRRRTTVDSPTSPPRVRFVNYYTASIGRPKKPRPQSGDGASELQGLEARMPDLSLSQAHTHSASPSPRLSVEEHRNDQVLLRTVGSTHSPIEETEVADILEKNSGKDDDLNLGESVSDSTAASSNLLLYLPEIPPMPEEPAPLKLPVEIDQNTRKYAEKGHAAAVKIYKEAVKSRDKVIKEREKIEAERAKRTRKQEEARNKASQKEEEGRFKGEKALAKAKEKAEKGRTIESPKEKEAAQTDEEVVEKIEAQEEQIAQHETNTAELLQVASSTSTGMDASLDGSRREFELKPSGEADAERQSSSSQTKPPRDRKFCILPSKTKNAAGESERDPTWVRVYMPGVDEVGAHCGLFYLGETYERLVGDVAGRVEGWCKDAEGERIAREFEIADCD